MTAARPRPRRIAIGLATVALLVGAAGCEWTARRVEHVRVPAAASTAGIRVAESPYLPAAPVLSAPEPVQIEVPAIGLRSPLVRLGLEPDGTMEVPRDFGTAGWYAKGPRPGESGPAVIAGHVDSHTGPAVFYRLRDLQPGDEVRVIRADGSAVRFVVQRSRSFAKRSFPTDTVFGPTQLPALRLVTCSGEFDWSRRSYLDNLVVFATLA